MIDLLVCEGSSALRSAVLTAIFSFIPLSRDPGPSAFLLLVYVSCNVRGLVCVVEALECHPKLPSEQRHSTPQWLRALAADGPSQSSSWRTALSQRLATSSKVTPVPSLGAAPCRGRKCRAARSGRLCRASSVGPSPLCSSS